MVYTPYLIQRCKLNQLNQPLPNKATRFGQAISLDYMGSAEFEFGAVANALEIVYINLDNYKLSKVDVFETVDGEKKQLRVFHQFNDEELTKYVAILKDLQHNKIRLKEASGFDLDSVTQQRKEHHAKIDLWIDLDNQVIFTYHKIAGNRLTEWCQASKKHFKL